jgi:ATP-binding cassette subfamily B protein
VRTFRWVRNSLFHLRAVLADPRIFIMDEATSSVDTITEANIQRGILGMMKGRTL